ncbi:hypothetical protein [Microlunatus phosphovorus]|nr:hypothetical protein [Microlunatus phosphovorus]
MSSTRRDEEAMPTRSPQAAGASMTTWVEPAEDDEDYYEPPKKRSRLTTGLVVALIFLLGMFTGVTVSRLLPSQQRPQVIYLLNNEGSPQASSGMPSGMPTDSPSDLPPGGPSGR